MDQDRTIEGLIPTFQGTAVRFPSTPGRRIDAMAMVRVILLAAAERRLELCEKRAGEGSGMGARRLSRSRISEHALPALNGHRQLDGRRREERWGGVMRRALTRQR
jgi:hypothetical protein